MRRSDAGSVTGGNEGEGDASINYALRIELLQATSEGICEVRGAAALSVRTEPAHAPTHRPPARARTLRASAHLASPPLPS